LFVGNLDPDVDEKMLSETFNAFGMIVSVKIVRDPETGASKDYGFVCYDSFESSDAALLAMNGQYFCNKMIHVSYAYKKDTKGERHGSAAERLLAANRPLMAKPGFLGPQDFNFSENSQLIMPPSLVTYQKSKALSMDPQNPAPIQIPGILQPSVKTGSIIDEEKFNKIMAGKKEIAEG